MKTINAINQSIYNSNVYSNYLIKIQWVTAQAPIYSKYNVSSKNISDAVLINLFSTVTPKSVIINEIDKQMKGLKNNGSANVTVSGLLSAIDGPQRLNNSVIVILTSNTIDFLDPDDMLALLRPGRIDRVFLLDELVMAKY